MPLTAAVLSLSPSMVTAGAASYPPSALALRVGFGRPPQAVPRGPGVAALAGRRYGIGSTQFGLDSLVKLMGSDTKLACMNGENTPVPDFSEWMSRYRYVRPHEPIKYVPVFQEDSQEERKIRLDVAKFAELSYDLLLYVEYLLRIEKNIAAYPDLLALAIDFVTLAKRTTKPGKPAGLFVTLVEKLDNLRRVISAATNKPLPNPSGAPKFKITETLDVDVADAHIMILDRFFVTVKSDIEAMLLPLRSTGRSA